MSTRATHPPSAEHSLASGGAGAAGAAATAARSGPGRARAKPAPRTIKAPKAASADECQTLEQLPNVGPAMAGDLRLLGLHHPSDLRGRDAFVLYRDLERATKHRQDPCVLDTFMAIVDFMNGAAPKPWWAYTAERKQQHGQVEREDWQRGGT